MPAYNAATTIARSIDSVLAQTRPELELIVVDDCSTDATPGLIAAYAVADPRVRVHRQPANAGVAAARNAGIELASGSHVAFLDSDDWWHPRKLELQIAQMQEAGARISYCSYRRVAENGEVLSIIRPPPRLSHADMLRSNFIGNLTGVYARDLGPARFLAIGHEDYVFWLQMIRRAGSALRIEHDEPLASYLVRDGSVSSNKLRAAGWQWRIYREIEGMSVPKASRYMLHYAWNALAKRR
jgi:glycosyltransferase involved in cell wall biosynthesis